MEPTIYKPSIYNGAGIYKIGGGGGGGGVACIRCNKNATSSNYISVPIDAKNKGYTYELGVNLSEDTGNNNGSIFEGIGNQNYSEIAMYTTSNGFNVVSKLNMVGDINLSGKKFNYQDVSFYISGNNAICKSKDLQGNEVSYSGSITVDCYNIHTINLFKVKSRYNMQGIQIYYLRVKYNDDLILDLVPDEQNSVPGFTDNVSGNFYGPNVNDGTFEAVKPRAPL